MSFGFAGRQKSASQGLLKAVSACSPMPFRGILKASGTVPYGRVPEAPGSPVPTSSVAPEHDPVERRPVLPKGPCGPRQSGPRRTSIVVSEVQTGRGGRRSCAFSLSRSSSGQVRVSGK